MIKKFNLFEKQIKNKPDYSDIIIFKKEPIRKLNMKINKILLVSPNGTIHIEPDGTKQTKECPLPIGLAYLSSQLFDYNVKIYDMIIENYYNEERISNDTILFGDNADHYVKMLKEFEPDLVGISCNLSNRSNTVEELLRRTKKINKEIITVVGGYHASAMPNHLNADFVCIGEADYSFPGLVNKLNKGEKVDKIVHSERVNVETLPFPDWDRVKIEKYWRKDVVPQDFVLKYEKYAIVNTSRGCPHICSYCAVPQHTGEKNYRARSLSSVKSELEWLIDKYQINEVHFGDDNFFVNKKRTKDLCKMLKEFDLNYVVSIGVDLSNLDYELIDLLKESNFHNLTLGIETGDQNIQNQFVDKRIDLNEIKKKVKYIIDSGLNPSGLFMIGFPNETQEQLERTIKLATSLNLNKIHIGMVTPIPATKLYENCIKNSLLYDDYDFTKLRYCNTFIKNDNIPREKLESIRKEVWKEYMSKKGVDIKEYDNRSWSKFK